MMQRLALLAGFLMMFGVLVGATYSTLKDIDGTLLVSQGNFGNQPLNKFGYNAAAAAATEESIWEGDDLAGRARCPTDTTAFTLFISSDAAGDTEVISVQGLDANWEAQTVEVTMAGLTFTQVGDASNWMRVNRAFNTGATDLVGTVYLHIDSVDAAVADGIPDTPATDTITVINGGENQTLQACYTVPDDFVAYLTGFCASNIGANSVSFRMRAFTAGAVGRVQDRFDIDSDITLCKSYFPYLKYPARTLLETTVTAGAGGSLASANFGMYVITD